MALTFIDVDFPTNLTVGLQASTFFNSNEVTTPQGISDIYQLGPDYARLAYTFDGSLMEIGGSEMDQLRSFYIQYRFNSFRLRDPVENSASLEEFGTGDGSTVAFQLYINFGSIQKPITKPVDDSDFKIYDDAVEQTETVDYTVDYDTGIVTFVVAPTAGHSLTWSGTYDIHARFDTNNLNNNVSGLRYGNFSGISLIEEITV